VLSAFVVPPVLNSFTSKPESHTEGSGSFLAANFLERLAMQLGYTAS
jgi:hypothetical protein